MNCDSSGGVRAVLRRLSRRAARTRRNRREFVIIMVEGEITVASYTEYGIQRFETILLCDQTRFKCRAQLESRSSARRTATFP
jgi:hypothetical protein